MSYKKATIIDVSRESGYSVTTVSLVLSGKESRVAQKTKIKIRGIAQRLNYQPNRAAVNLVTKTSKTVGMMVTDLNNPHIATYFTAVDSVLHKHGYAMICHTSDLYNDYSIEVLSKIVAENVAGIFLAQPFSVKDDPQQINELKEYLKCTGIPIVSRDVSELNYHGIDIQFDYFEGARLATQHLLDLGHTRIGCVTGTPFLKVTTDRINGYKHALEASGIPFNQELLYTGNYTMESASQALSYLMGQQVTAIFSFNDEMAFALYKSARQYGIHIPGDISIIGFDNVPFSDVLKVPLTSIDIPTHEIGIFAAQKMLDMIGNGIPESLETIKFSPKLMIRGSTSRIDRE